jgi:hypothetical protein
MRNKKLELWKKQILQKNNEWVENNTPFIVYEFVCDFCDNKWERVVSEEEIKMFGNSLCCLQDRRYLCIRESCTNRHGWKREWIDNEELEKGKRIVKFHPRLLGGKVYKKVGTNNDLTTRRSRENVWYLKNFYSINGSLRKVWVEYKRPIESDVKIYSIRYHGVPSQWKEKFPNSSHRTLTVYPFPYRYDHCLEKPLCAFSGRETVYSDDHQAMICNHPDNEEEAMNLFRLPKLYLEWIHPLSLYSGQKQDEVRRTPRPSTSGIVCINGNTGELTIK